MKKIIFLLIIVTSSPLFSQQWIDTVYAIQTDNDITYGTAEDFAGVDQTLELDISFPINDTSPICGRPLLVVIHGGAWLTGDKNDGYAKRLREDFAKRGYTTASINYRLGQFHTDQFVNCNVPDWNCWNMTDSSEWYRANYRGIQDANGAIRYLINNASSYNIDPNNVFVVGESAGAFIAMGVGYIDDTTDILGSLIDMYPDAPPPNTLYEVNCIQNYNLATSISNMNLSRPDLGLVDGNLNLPVNSNHTIKGVGSFFGGVFNNIFQAHNGISPALYLYHQPCDLIVPFNYSRILAGYNNCLIGFPTNCGYIVNRPKVYGSKGIKTLIDTLISNNISTCDYYYDVTTNNYNCLQQASDPSLSCHAIDNYWLRTSNMATYFSEKIGPCSTVGHNHNDSKYFPFKVYQSTYKTLYLEIETESDLIEVSILNIQGKVVISPFRPNSNHFKIELTDYHPGIFIIKIVIDDKLYTKKISLN